MADFHSSNSTGTQRIRAPQFLRRKDKTLFAKDSWVQGWNDASDEKEYHTSATRKKRQRYRGSTNSEKSSRSSSVTSNTGYRTSMETVPVENTPTYSKIRAMGSEPSQRASGVPLTVQTEALHDEDAFWGTEMGVSPAEVPPRQSPRSHMGKLQTESPSRPRTVYSGPLERFLAQDDDDGLTDDGNDPPQPEEEWRRLQASRANTFRLRAQLREKRKELHEKEVAKSIADDAFIKHVREHRSMSKDSSSSADPVLSGLYAAMQDARDNYGPVEDDCNKLEDLLEQQEFQMGKIEGRLYRTKVPNTTEPVPTLQGLSPEPPEEYHPLHSSYLSRLGDLDIANERHDEMIQERDNLLYQRGLRSNLGIQLRQDEQQFLDEFETAETTLLEEIEEIEQDVERQKLLCLEAGIDLYQSESGDSSIGDSSIGGSSIGDIADIEDELDLTGDSSNQITVVPSMFPLLLPKSYKDKVKLGVLITDFDEANKSDRINRWMRYQLQTSPLAVELLVRVFLGLKIVDVQHWQRTIHQWQISVLFWWNQDDANRPPEIFKSPLTHSSVVQTLISVILSGKAHRSSERTSAVDVSNPIRRIRSAPCHIDLRKLFKKDEMLMGGDVLTDF